MKKENLKYSFNFFLASRSYDAEILECVPKIRQTLPKIKLKKLPELNLSIELAG